MTSLRQYLLLSDLIFISSVSMQFMLVWSSSSKRSSEELSSHWSSIFLYLSGDPGEKVSVEGGELVTSEETVESVADGNVVLVFTGEDVPGLAEPDIVEAVLELAAVVDVLDDVGRGGREGGEVAGGAQVHLGGAGGEVDHVPVVVISLATWPTLTTDNGGSDHWRTSP